MCVCARVYLSVYYYQVNPWLLAGFFPFHFPSAIEPPQAMTSLNEQLFLGRGLGYVRKKKQKVVGVRPTFLSMCGHLSTA